MLVELNLSSNNVPIYWLKKSLCKTLTEVTSNTKQIYMYGSWKINSCKSNYFLDLILQLTGLRTHLARAAKYHILVIVINSPHASEHMSDFNKIQIQLTHCLCATNFDSPLSFI